MTVTRYRCPRCKKLFGTDRGARQHMRDKHNVSLEQPTATLFDETDLGHDTGWNEA